MRIVLETPQIEGDKHVGSSQTVIPDGVPPMPGFGVTLGAKSYYVRTVDLVVDDSPYGAWYLVRLETAEQHVHRRNVRRAAEIR